jgi:hypothetical protein
MPIVLFASSFSWSNKNQDGIGVALAKIILFLAEAISIIPNFIPAAKARDNSTFLK